VATENNTVTILLGNGSGGFTSPAYSPLAPQWGAYSVAVGQFNGDGHTDLAVAANDYFEIYDGAALPQLQITQQPSSGTVGGAFGNVVVQVNDVNGNLMTGSTAQITLSSNPAGVGGTVTANASGGIATFSNLVFSAAGSFVLSASSPGTVSSPAGPTIQIAAGSQTISFGAISSQTMGTPVALNATASSGLTVNFASLTSTVCAVSGNTATLLKIGKCKIQATQPGNASYLAATPVDQSFEVTQGSQTITFTPPANQPYGTPPFTLTATASSGLAVKYASTTTTVCTVSGATVTLVKPGKCTIRASQAGNANWAAAAPVTESFEVTKASQTITFGSLPNEPLSTGSITVGATASSGLTVTFASTTTKVCTVSGTKVTLIKTGTCTIKASQAGNADYAAAPAVDQSFQVTASNP
jgi:FG-GAP-like repeat